MLETKRVSVMAKDYPPEVIQGAQVLGARVCHDHFFPEWKVNLWYTEGWLNARSDGEYYVITISNATGFDGFYILRVPRYRKEKR